METVCSGGAPFGQWALYTFIILIISTAIYAFIYFLSKIMNNSKLSSRVSHEIMQMFFTTGLFIVILMLYSGMCGFDLGPMMDSLPGADGNYESYYCGTSDCVSPFDFGMAYLKKFLTWSSDMFVVTTITYSTAGGVAGTNVNIETNSLSPFGGVKSFVDLFIGLGAMSIVVMLLSAMTQIFILYFSWSPMVGVFLPIGFLFRSFAPTRTIGGAIIGAVLTLSIFYPLLLMLDGLIMKTIMPENYLGPATLASGSVVLSWMALSGNKIAMSAMKNPTIAHWLQGHIGTGRVMKIADVLIKLDKGLHYAVLISILLSVFFFIIFLIGIIGSLFIGGVLLPVLNILILSSISTTISGILGESLNVANLTRMI